MENRHLNHKEIETSRGGISSVLLISCGKLVFSWLHIYRLFMKLQLIKDSCFFLKKLMKWIFFISQIHLSIKCLGTFILSIQNSTHFTPIIQYWAKYSSKLNRAKWRLYKLEIFIGARHHPIYLVCIFLHNSQDVQKDVSSIFSL